MKNFSSYKLRLLFTLSSLGPIRIVALLLLTMASLALLVAIPMMQRQNAQVLDAIGKIGLDYAYKKNSQSVALIKDVRPKDGVTDFYDVLGEKKFAEQQLKLIFSIAVKSGVVLKSGDYKLSEDAVGEFFTYRVQFPIKGTYQQIRRFSEEVLLAIPFASLDEVSFKRDAISNPVIDSKVSFTIYLTDKPHEKSGWVE